MSEETVTMDDMLDAIRDKNLSQARAHFDDLMSAKVGDALESEKVAIASQFYGGPVEAEDDFEVEAEADYGADLDAEEHYDTDVESEVEDIFDEGESFSDEEESVE